MLVNVKVKKFLKYFPKNSMRLNNSRTNILMHSKYLFRYNILMHSKYFLIQSISNIFVCIWIHNLGWMGLCDRYLYRSSVNRLIKCYIF